MTSPASTTKIDDLVMKAIKEKLAERAHQDLYSKMAESASSESVAPAVDVTSVSKVSDLRDDQVPVSVVIDNTTVAVINNFGVTVFPDADVWHESIRSFIPEINNDYVIPVEPAICILRAWELGEQALVYGPTGAGKSSLIEQLCARTGRPFVRINCTGDMDSSMIFGQLTARDGSTHWVDGALTEAVRHGAVFAWDEWDVTPPEISMGLQWLLEDNGKLFLKEMPGDTESKQVIPHKNFRIVALGNTQGQGDESGAHAGTNVQNSATLDRFGTAVYVGYMQQSDEAKMLCKQYPELRPQEINELVSLANLIRTAYQSDQLSLTMSPRTLISICRKRQFGCTLLEAFNVVYSNKLSTTQAKVAQQFYAKVFSSSPKK